LKDLNVLTAKDLVVGGRYLTLGMDYRANLSFSSFELLSKKGKSEFAREKKGEFVLTKSPGLRYGEFYESDQSLTDMGCPPDGRSFNNHHRTFEDTLENRRVLESLIETQDSVSWLTFLGVENPDAEIGERLLNAEEIDELNQLDSGDFWEDFFDQSVNLQMDHDDGHNY
jgi:hypothetical protein